MPKTYAQAKAALQADNYDSNIAGQIERIEDSKVVIVQKLHDMKDEETNITIDEAALSLDAVGVYRNNSHQLAPGDTWAVPAGYYAGYTVTADGATHDYDLGTATCTPTKSTQTITRNDAGTNPSTGNPYYGLSSVTVNPIPDAYQDVTGVTATQAQVLAGAYYVTSQGDLLQGTMVNRGATGTPNVSDYQLYIGRESYSISEGYYNGNGHVIIVPEQKTVDASDAADVIVTPTAGKVLSQVTVNQIDKDTYLTNWTSNATAGAGQILSGYTAYIGETDISGHAIATIGTMVDNTGTWDVDQGTPIDHILTATSTSISVPAGYHNGSGVVKVVPEDQTFSWNDIASHLASTSPTWTITATTGKVLRTITLAGKPANWIDTTETTSPAGSGDIVAGQKAYVNGALVTGNIPIDGGSGGIKTFDVSTALMSATSSSTNQLATADRMYYPNGLEIVVNNTLYNRLAAI